MKNICIIIALLVMAIPCFALERSFNDYSFSKIDGNDGLSHNNIKSIIQDSRGFMWFGTRNGLNRYDGRSIKIFNCIDKEKNKADNNISALFEDQDKNIWVGTDKGVYIFNLMTEVFSFFDLEADNGFSMHDWVSEIQSDRNGNIWVVVPNQGVFRFNLSQKKLYHYFVVEKMRPSISSPQCICIESNGRVWIGTNHEGVFLYHHEDDSFTQYLGDKNGGMSLKGKNIFTLCDYGEELIVGVHEEKLQKLHKRSNTLKDVLCEEVHYSIIRDVECYDNQLWVATQNGIYVIDETQNKKEHLYNDPALPYSLSSNIVEKIYKDKEGNVWFGTHFGGASYLPNRGYGFEKHMPLEKQQSISSKIVREMYEDQQGRIWIGTEDNGLNLFHPATRTFEHIPLSENQTNTLGLLISGKQVWVGAFKNGLDVVDSQDFSVKHYSAADLGLNDASVYTICEDSNDNIWMGCAWSVYVSPKHEMNFKRFNRFGLNFIFDIAEDKSGNIWVATMGNGAFKYNVATDSVTHYQTQVGNPRSISSNSISSITISSAGDVWFATDRGGICRYNKKTDDFSSFSIQDGLPDNIVYKILEDRDGNLWFGTNKGLVRFNPSSKQTKVFTQNDGLPENQFNYKSALVSSSGLLYFGTLNGMIIFNPYQLKTNEYIPPVFITRMTIYNKEVEVGKDSPLSQSIIHTADITLPYDQSNISFDFAALSYIAPRANQYAYKLEGIDAGWNYTNKVNTSSYAKIPPGKYRFRVKGSNNDGVWNEQESTIGITILPPWWLSKAAVATYLLLIVGLLYLLVTQYNKKNRRRREEQQHIFEMQKEKELYSLKMEFFTNIAHEIRTPVTLINGPLEAMLQMEMPNALMQKNLHIMEQSTAQLLQLVNQLLDFRKVDSNKLKLHIISTNVSLIMEETIAAFTSSVANKGKEIVVNLPHETIMAAVDKAAFQKIMNNLLSNALKYSQQKISIKAQKEAADLIIEISNDGKRVPAEYKDKIFETFYQLSADANTESSSGIGLALARSLTWLHQGDLYLDVDSPLNTFVLKMPLQTIEDRTEYVEEEEIYIEGNDADIEKVGENVILVVEDNPELRAFLTDRLSETFTVKTANSGAQALRVLHNNRIDILVSDVMMDNMDGIQLCEKIKTDVEYCHIPIILLTAKNDLATKIRGLEAGAEAYIEKPFSFNFLITQISTLLNNRKREREAFLKKPFLGTQQISMSKSDELFVTKIIQLILENISEADFGVERLAELSYLSRASLLRKIKGLSGLTPSEFIKAIKLKRAAELILSRDYQVNEVSYLVGISSPSYFIKLFQKQFGVTPKDYLKMKGEE